MSLLTGTAYAQAQPEPAIRLAPAGSAGAQVYALVVGIDDYRYVPQLYGAVADAQDIERSLRNDGVTHVTTLLDAAVTRAAMTQAMSDIIGKVHAGDLVIVSFAGHGSQEPAKVVTKDNGGYDEVFILANFDDDSPAHLAERLLDKEIFSWLSQLDGKGVGVIFLADTCHSGGLSKTIDPRIGRVTYRALRAVSTRGASNPAAGTYYAGASDDPAQAAAAHLPEAPATDNLKQLTFLAAVDKWTESPEIAVPPDPTPRGAVSYSFARALEGEADYNHDGIITRRELLRYMDDKTRDLTHNGQYPEFAPRDARRLDDVLFVLHNQGEDRIVAASALNDASSVAPNTHKGAVTVPRIKTRGIGRSAIRIGVVNGTAPDKSATGRGLTPFSLAATDGKARGFDAVWDAANGDVVDWVGDIMARRVQAAELAGLADRVSAVEKLQHLARSASARVELVPNKPVYKAKEIARLQVDGADGRYLIVADITGNGILQFVYPLQGDEPLVLAARPGDPKVIGDIYIKPPYGSDAVVAIASKERLKALEELLIRRNNQQASREFVEALEQLPPGSADVSFLSFVSEP